MKIKNEIEYKKKDVDKMEQRFINKRYKDFC